MLLYLTQNEIEMHNWGGLKHASDTKMIRCFENEVLSIS